MDEAPKVGADLRGPWDRGMREQWRGEYYFNPKHAAQLRFKERPLTDNVFHVLKQGIELTIEVYLVLDDLLTLSLAKLAAVWASAPGTYQDGPLWSAKVMFPAQSELAKHALSEAEKAVNKAQARRTEGVSPDGPAKVPTITKDAGLTLSVEHTRLVFFTASAGMPLPDDHAVAMTAVLEYYVTELLELSGNAARDSHGDDGEPHIMPSTLPWLL